MANSRAIWRHEKREANQISRNLIQDQAVEIDWRIILLPLFLMNIIHYRHRLRVLRKNLLYTRRLAFDAAQNIIKGEERGWQVRRIEIKTQEALDRDKSGQYTEKIRRKQLGEIEPLITHYVDLINTDKSNFPEMIKALYPSRSQYLNFLNSIHKLEEEVIQAAIATTRKGTKKERRVWFDKVKAVTQDVRMSDVDRIYAEQ